MSSKPLRPCNYIRCPNLTRNRYCEEHLIEKAQSTKEYDLYQRDKRSTAFYKSKEWRTLRDYIFQKQHGLCQSCIKDNKFVAGNVVDHKIPIKQDWNKRLEEDNLQVLCHKCHNRKTFGEKM